MPAVVVRLSFALRAKDNRTTIHSKYHAAAGNYTFVKEMKLAIEICRLYQIRVHMAMIEQAFPRLILMP